MSDELTRLQKRMDDLSKRLWKTNSKLLIVGMELKELKKIAQK